METLKSVFHSNNTVLAGFLMEILRENQIPCYTSQEAVGKEIYPVTIGKLSEIDVLVPVEFTKLALEIIQAYLSTSNPEQSSENSTNNSHINLEE